MSYVLVHINDDIEAPMATVTEALRAAGLPVEYYETRNLAWVLDEAKRHIRDLQHFTEALTNLVDALTTSVDA